jgi:lipid-A-disaccharide synthase
MIKPPEGPSSCDIFIIAGEPSGDLHGSSLIQTLLNQKKDLIIGAVSGPKMRQHKIKTYFQSESLEVMGFTDVFFALPRILKLFFSLRKKILELNPKAVVTIDYPGFNLALCKSLRNSGYKGKLIHYICPSIWAWKKHRINKMEKCLDLLLTILPFETDLFLNSSLKACYVGHPLVEARTQFNPSKNFRECFGFTKEEKILAIFPGSRKQEISKNLPLMLKAAEQLRRKDPKLRIAISKGHPNSPGTIPSSFTYDLMNNAHVAIAKSGTITLELALFQVPTIVVYAINKFDYWIAKSLLKIKTNFISLPNIILNQQLFPELYGPTFCLLLLSEELTKLWFQPDEVKHECQKIFSKLGNQNANVEAAQRILDSIL